jgi:hypothetical protein
MESKEKGLNRNLVYIILAIIAIVLVFYYTGGNFINEKIPNINNDVCNDPEGEINDLFSQGQVMAGSDEIGRVGFTDTCLSTAYDGRLDQLGLQIYLSKLGEAGVLNEDNKDNMNILLEAYCPEVLPDNINEITPFSLITAYECPNGCVEGRCIK